MEAAVLPVLIIAPALLLQPAYAIGDTLHQYGASAPLGAIPGFPPPLPRSDLADPGVRPVYWRTPYLARRPADAQADASLPEYVDTGGTRRNADGLRAPHGSVSGAAGNLQYMQLAGGDLAIYTKDTGRLLLGPVNINTLFYDAPQGAAMNACRAQPAHDAAVLYDQLAKRWLVSYQAALPGRAYFQCIAISTSADAGGSYFRYALELKTPSGAPQFADDAKIALWPDAYYLSFSLFDTISGDYAGPRICGLERSALARGSDATLHCRDLGPTAAPVAPVHMEGYAAPDGNPPGIFIALDSAAQALTTWQFSWSTGALSHPDSIPVRPFAVTQEGIRQPPPGVALIALQDRLGPRLVYRNDDGRESIVASHTVQAAAGQAGVRWYEIGNPFGRAYLVQQGTIETGAESRFMGSIGVDNKGNIAVGYSVASSDTPPGIRYTGREMDDPLGRMQTEEVIVNGAGVQSDAPMAVRTTGAMTLDPIDGCTFWYTQRYVPYTGNGTWRTRIASFRFHSCH